MNRNPQRAVARAWMGVAVVAAGLTALPFLIGMDGMSGGFALAFVSFFLAICGVVVAVIYGSRARALDRILSGAGLLARWSVDPETRRRAADVEYAEEKKVKAGLFLVVAVITVVIGLVFLLVDREVGWMVFLVLVGVLAIIGLVACAGPRLRVARSRRATDDVLISRDGATVNGAFHTWRLLGASLEGAELVEGSPVVLRIAYSAPVRTGRQGYTVHVPVPPGEEETARRVAEELTRLL